MYSTVFPDWFGDGGDWQSVAWQVAFDMAVIGPFLCLPVAYIVKSLVNTTGDNTLSALERMQQSLDKYVEDVMERGLLLKYWALWIPVQTLTFGVVPQHFRVAFVALVSFFWVTILSSISAATSSQSDEKRPLSNN